MLQIIATKEHHDLELHADKVLKYFNTHWGKYIKNEYLLVLCSAIQYHLVSSSHHYNMCDVSRLSCRIFDSFGSNTLSDYSFCSNQPFPTLTTWSHKSRQLSWFPPLHNLGSVKPRLTIPLMSTSKCHLVPKCILCPTDI